jgi:hypothetical protein
MNKLINHLRKNVPKSCEIVIKVINNLFHAIGGRRHEGRGIRNGQISKNKRSGESRPVIDGNHEKIALQALLIYLKGRRFMLLRGS